MDRDPATGPVDPAAAAIPIGVSRPALGLVQGSDLFSDPAASGPALAAALRWLAADQAAGVGRTIAGHAEVKRWVDEPIAALEAHVESRRARAGLAALRRRLQADLLGATITLADVHGDVSAGRWWFDAAGEHVVTVDGWEAIGRGPVELDALTIVVAARILGGTSEPGLTRAVGDLLSAGWTAEEQEALGADWPANDQLRPSTLVLLGWLHGVTELYGPMVDHRRRAQIDAEVELLLEQLAPGGLLDSPASDAGLVIDLTDLGRPAAERAEHAVARAIARADDAAASARHSRRTFALVVVAVGAWLGAVWGLDPSTMTDTGLVSILRPGAAVALLALLVAFGLELAAPRTRTWRLAAPVVTLVALLHGTPSALYGNLRYSWAWKHLGIVDYIHRHGSVDPHAAALDVYHNWPGFFAWNSALTDLFGLPTAATYARWWPVAANLAAIPALHYVYRGLRGGASRRARWLAVAIFLVSNWIGQDYFSPQSLGFLLYLVVIAVVLQFTGTDLREADRIGGARPRRWSIAMVMLAAAALITSHQVTPIVLVASLFALALTRQARAGRIALGTVGLLGLWAVTGAWGFMSRNVASLVEGFGEPVSNANGNLVDQGRLSDGQVLVSTMGRVTLAAVALLAVAGVVRELRRRRVDGAALALLVAPASILFANSFGGEIGFRAYLFALPLLSWYAALAIWPAIAAAGTRLDRPAVLRRAVAAVAATAVLLSGFVFGYYGKDSYYTFSGNEVAASEYVLTTAPPGSLLVTVTANYPGQWKDYEHLTYVPIAGEPVESRRRILADPVDVLAGWLSGDEYRTGYILLTRSQEREVDQLGVLPHGSVARLRRALEASPRFRTAFASPEAQVFVLVDDGDR